MHPWENIHSLQFRGLQGCICACWMSMLLLVYLPSSNAAMSSILAGSITFELDYDFETSRMSTFFIRTVFDITDGLGLGSGLEFSLGNQVTGTADIEDRLGVIEFSPQVVSRTANAFTLERQVGDHLHGLLTIRAPVPLGTSQLNCSIVLKNGDPIVRGPGALGTLPQCNLVGASQTPCSINLNPAPADFMATLNIPPTKPRFRFSPVPSFPSVSYITRVGSTLIPLPAFDSDGDTVITFPVGSGSTSSGVSDLFCSNGLLPTNFGCDTTKQGVYSPLQGYKGSYVTFSTEKVLRDNLKFFYSYTFDAVEAQSDGSIDPDSHRVRQEFLVQFCNPQGASVPQIITFNSTNQAVADDTPASIRCAVQEECYFTVHTLHSVSGDQPSGTAVEVQLLSGQPFASLQSVSTRAGASSSYRISLSSASGGNFTLQDTSRTVVVCYYAIATNVRCPSPSRCTTVRVVSNPPIFVERDEDASGLNLTAIPLVAPISSAPNSNLTNINACLDVPLTFAIRGRDLENEPASVVVADSDERTLDFFAAPFNARRSTRFDESTKTAATIIDYTLSRTTGVLTDSTDGGVRFPPNRRLCAYTVDSSLAVYRRFGDLPSGNFRSTTRCFSVQFQGPPTFTQPSESQGILTLFVGQTLNYTLQARDPNPADGVIINIMEDPGLPPGTLLGPSRCSKTVVQLGGGASVVSTCSLATRSLSWTPGIEDLDRTVKICAVARDDSGDACFSVGAARATPEGWYGPEACLIVSVVPVSLATGSMHTLHGVVKASVGCKFNATVHIQALTNATLTEDFRVLIRWSSDQGPPAWISSSPILNLPGGQVGWEVTGTPEAQNAGQQLLVCVEAQEQSGSAGVRKFCANIVVRLCAACISPGESLEEFALRTGPNGDWKRVWALNIVPELEATHVGQAAGSEEKFHAIIHDPFDIQDSNKPLRFGNLYRVSKPTTASGLAAQLGTTTRALAKTNPHVDMNEQGLQSGGGESVIESGTELCIAPCST